jgi:hypothetical protein
VTDGGLQEAGSALTGDASSLLVATYNVENLNPASNPFAALAEDVVALNLPDILALQEVQDASSPVDDGVTSGEATAAAVISAVEELTGEEGQYRYLEIPPVDGTSGDPLGPYHLLEHRVGDLARRTAPQSERLTHVQQ